MPIWKEKDMALNWDEGLQRTLLYRKDINLITHTIYRMLLDIIEHFNMNRPCPWGLLPFAEHNFTLENIEETEQAYKCMRELSNCYSSTVSKLLLNFILTLAIDEYHPTNFEKTFIITTKISYLIKLIEGKVLVLELSLKHLQYKIKHPIKKTMDCLCERIEWYNDRLDILSALHLKAAQINAESKITDVVHDLTFNQDIDHLDEDQILIRQKFYEAEKVQNEKEPQDEAKDHVRSFLKAITEFRCNTPFSRIVNLQQSKATICQYIPQESNSKILTFNEDSTISSDTSKPLVITTVFRPNNQNKTIVKGVDINTFSHETVVQYDIAPRNGVECGRTISDDGSSYGSDYSLSQVTTSEEEISDADEWETVTSSSSKSVHGTQGSQE